MSADKHTAAMLSDTLPPLPEPDGWIYDGRPDGLEFRREPYVGMQALLRSSAPMYTAHQMRAYAAAAVQAEREACAMACEAMGPAMSETYGDGAECINTAESCAASIRARKDAP